MNYSLRINEKVSSVYEENLKFLLTTTGYDELNKIVPDLATDVCDEFTQATWEKDSLISLKYKRAKRNQTTNINIDYFTDDKKNLTEIDKKYVADFLSKAEYAVVMKLRYTLVIKIGDIDEDKIVTELQNLVDHLKSYGYKVIHQKSQSYYGSPDEELTDFKSYVKEQCANMKRWVKSFNPCLNPYYIGIEENIDIDLFKPGNDYLTTLPNKIISDFKAFCDRFRMNSGDREQLAELIKKSKEE
jgi:hypothetical protein